MGRRFDAEKLVIASHNPGKIREIGMLLAPYEVEVVSVGDYGFGEPVEDGDSFAANALIKARAAAEGTGLPALADDSGLAVTALGGAPGLYSARWAGPDKDFIAAMRRVWDELGPHTDKSAAFICALALVWPDGQSETVEGRVDGRIIWPMRGSGGFGYDPVFEPSGENQTFGEMDTTTKQAISHRSRAFTALIEACFAR